MASHKIVINRVPTGTMGLAASWEHLDTGLIPGPAQWVKDLTLPQLQLRLRLRLSSDPWPRNSICLGVAKKEKKKSSQIISIKQRLLFIINTLNYAYYKLFMMMKNT